MEALASIGISYRLCESYLITPAPHYNPSGGCCRLGVVVCGVGYGSSEDAIKAYKAIVR